MSRHWPVGCAALLAVAGHDLHGQFPERYEPGWLLGCWEVRRGDRRGLTPGAGRRVDFAFGRIRCSPVP